LSKLRGDIDHHQLTLILDVLGTPTMEDYYGIKSRRAREYIRSLPFKKKIPFKVMFPKTNDLALDLLEKLLAFNPAKRITVEDALRHPYLEPYHDPDDEPTANPIPEEFFDFDKDKDSLSKEELKRKLSILSTPFLSPPAFLFSFLKFYYSSLSSFEYSA
jgi:mitogen-activated protein kinase 1/3